MKETSFDEYMKNVGDYTNGDVLLVSQETMRKIVKANESGKVHNKLNQSISLLKSHKHELKTVSDRQINGYKHFEEHNKLMVLQNSMLRVIIVLCMANIVLEGIGYIF